MDDFEAWLAATRDQIFGEIDRLHEQVRRDGAEFLAEEGGSPEFDEVAQLVVAGRLSWSDVCTGNSADPVVQSLHRRFWQAPDDDARRR
ncbi:hypothetical protein [Virgisporangium aliadipatigenens]|uniref:hypothetical protein n=1 Tax=Virgisporangium aliadipatigenens TaxID=741659 RepID=UPI0019430352|nr:hypothetical protein [Virgisporangium aliadipatigenens]